MPETTVAMKAFATALLLSIATAACAESEDPTVAGIRAMCEVRGGGEACVLDQTGASLYVLAWLNKKPEPGSTEREVAILREQQNIAEACWAEFAPDFSPGVLRYMAKGFNGIVDRLAEEQ